MWHSSPEVPRTADQHVQLRLTVKWAIADSASPTAASAHCHNP